MIDDYIPYDEAMALKELGFTEDCYGYYTKVYNRIDIYSIKPDDIGSANGDSKQYGDCTAPLWQQAFAWFREEHALYHNIWNYTHSEPTHNPPSGFKFSIDEDWVCIVGKDKVYQNYYEAELECLRKLIQLAKEKK